MSYFHGVYIANPELSGALDLLRFLAEPRFLRRAHITVRGPYINRQEAMLSDLRLISNNVKIRGIDCFKSERQKTIFLKCKIPGISEVWRKPDYPGVNPHITLYDGGIEGEFVELRYIFSAYKWKIDTDITNLYILEKKIYVEDVLSVIYEGMSNVYRNVTFREFDAQMIYRMNIFERYHIIDRVCAYVNRRQWG